jgi:hypothetical protein
MKNGFLKNFCQIRKKAATSNEFDFKAVPLLSAIHPADKIVSVSGKLKSYKLPFII